MIFQDMTPMIFQDTVSFQAGSRARTEDNFSKNNNISESKNEAGHTKEIK